MAERQDGTGGAVDCALYRDVSHAPAHPLSKGGYLMTARRIASLVLITVVVALTASNGSLHAHLPSPASFFVRLVLSAIYRTTKGPDWNDNATWVIDAPVGEWYGVAVDGDGRVTGLLLDIIALSGPIAPELAGQDNLQVLRLESS